MRITNITRWLLATMLLVGCGMSAVSPTATDAALMTVPTIARRHVADKSKNDEATLPTTGVVAATTPAPSPTSKVASTPIASIVVPSATAPAVTETPTATQWSTAPHPLQIEVMRQQSYPGSPLTVEQTLNPGANYDRYIVSYQSEGNKIYALLTIPNGTRPDTGWPVIVFNHGYIAPAEYRTTDNYVAYVDRIARNGYIVFKPDYRGWGNSEGGNTVGGGYGLPALTVDVLNAVASLKAYEEADPNRIGMWGHSMGGQLTLRAMVVSQDIKAGAIWGGVVAPYPEIIARWDFSETVRFGSQSARDWIEDFHNWVTDFSTEYGTPDENQDWWITISPNTYLADLSGPIELHHSVSDEMVPLAWSEILVEELQDVGRQPYELFTYPGDNHNISANFGVAMERTVAFFDKYVKGQ